MTRRRLFGYLCLVSFLLMAGAWWFSYQGYSYLVISSPRGRSSINCKLRSGTVAIGVNPSYGSSGSWFIVNTIPNEDLDELYIERFGWTDRIGFDEEDMSVLMGGVTRHSYVYHYLYLPLWLIYLVFVATAFVFLRIPDGRAWFFKEWPIDPAKMSDRNV